MGLTRAGESSPEQRAVRSNLGSWRLERAETFAVVRCKNSPEVPISGKWLTRVIIPSVKKKSLGLLLAAALSFGAVSPAYAQNLDPSTTDD